MGKKIKTYNDAWQAVYGELGELFKYASNHFNMTNALPAVDTLGPHSSVTLKIKTSIHYPLEMHENQLDCRYSAEVRFSFQKDSVPAEKGFRLTISGSAMLAGGSIWGEASSYNRQINASSRFNFETDWFDKDDALAEAVGAIDRANFVKTIKDMLDQLHKDMVIV